MKIIRRKQRGIYTVPAKTKKREIMLKITKKFRIKNSDFNTAWDIKANKNILLVLTVTNS